MSACDLPLTLFPRPQMVRVAAGRSEPPLPQVYLPPELRSARLQNALRILGFSPVAEAARVALSLKAMNRTHDAYQLKITPEPISLAATSERGLFHGLVTLRQILDQSGQAVPCLEIEDWPDLDSRGYMLDISRCKVPKMESLYELVDLLAALKFNQFQLYTEHTFAYRDHEQVWRDSSPLTAREVQDLDEYCYARYVELVPNQNSFGHMERWLRHDAYKSLAESPNGFEHPLSGWKEFGSTLKPIEESVDFMDALFEELLPNFRSRKFNIGGDEPWELGQGFSKSQARERGKRRVYLDHLLKLQERVEGRGREMQFWGDILLEEPSMAKELPRNVTALLWGYERSHPFAEQCAAMRDSGVPFYVVPGTSTWNTTGGRLDNAFFNIEAAASTGIEKRAEGLLLTDWGDNGHHQSHLLSIPPLLKAAGLSWSFAANLDVDLSEIAWIILPDSLPKSGYNQIIQLSQTARCFSKHLHNGTWLNKILFAKPGQRAPLAADLRPDELERAQEHLESFSASGELELARRLLLFATRKGQSILEKRRPDPLPDALLASYREHWLARNRPGGLQESVSFLTEANH